MTIPGLLIVRDMYIVLGLVRYWDCSKDGDPPRDVGKECVLLPTGCSIATEMMKQVWSLVSFEFETRYTRYVVM